MQSLSDQSQIDAWRSYMKDYQAARRQGPAATEVSLKVTRCHTSILTKKSRPRNMPLTPSSLSSETPVLYDRG